MSFWIVVMLSGCGPKEWTSHEQCPDVGNAADREACWVATLPKLFCTKPDDAAALVEKEITKQVDKDYVWLQVTNKVAPETPKYCSRIQNEDLKKECLQVTQRPHLHPYTTADFCPDNPRKLRSGEQPGRGPNRGGPPGPNGAPPPPGALPGAGGPEGTATPAGESPPVR